jgi:FtsH-binding integral membrane protein
MLNLVTLTPVQITYLRKMIVLLMVQMLVLLVVVFGIHRLAPERFCLITCEFWVDIVLYLLLAMVCFGFIFGYNDYTSVQHYWIRCGAFLCLGVLLAYVLAVQYNLMIRNSSNPTATTRNFFVALVLTILIFTVVFTALPILLQYTTTMAYLSLILFGALLVILILSLVTYRSHALIVLSLIVFLGYLVTDLTLLTYQCTTPDTRACDPPTGATNLYLDLVNILQKLYLLLDRGNQ